MPKQMWIHTFANTCVLGILLDDPANPGIARMRVLIYAMVQRMFYLLFDRIDRLSYTGDIPQRLL